ncbi:MAG: hypothetical protein HXX12_10440 [Geothrix sp.]|uniref:hypothetical protein n=1 Tax=Geothrix sp. TaxID=1962974 RepID=UPI0018375747|nr:hypothetical protein [Geothrix sp.]NWJ41376.1 hypothetical protein [Geothrix sp.]WIL20637.1 MAG: hypothetical protein QOZ81_003216 [Geothrix sp.]
MFREITIQRLSAGSLFKLSAIGLFTTLIPFSILMGFGALFGASTVTWNQQAITGVAGLIASPFIGAFIALIFTMFLGCSMAFGLWLFSQFRPLTLLVKELDEVVPNPALNSDPATSD